MARALLITNPAAARTEPLAVNVVRDALRTAGWLTEVLATGGPGDARRLAEYRRMKEAAAWLRERLQTEGDRFFRLGPSPLAPRVETPLAPQDPDRLAQVIRLLAVEPPEVSLAHMALRFPPVLQFLERFRAVLRRRTRFDFDGEVGGLPRIEQAVAFLALLELRRSGEITIDQAAPFAPIRVVRTGEEIIDRDERTVAWNLRSA